MITDSNSPVPGSGFQLFRAYREVYGTNNLPQICTFWLLGFMIPFSASLICGGMVLKHWRPLFRRNWQIDEHRTC